MPYIRKLKDPNGQTIYPVTNADAVIMKDNQSVGNAITSLDTGLNNFKSETSENFTKVNTSVQDVSKKHDTLQSDYNAFKTSANGSISTLTSGLDTFKTETNKSLSTLTTNVTSVTNNHNTLQKDYDTFKSSTNGSITSMTGDISDLDTQVDALNKSVKINSWTVAIPATAWKQVANHPIVCGKTTLNCTWQADITVAGVTVDTDFSVIKYASGDLDSACTWAMIESGAGKVTIWSEDQITADFTLQLFSIPTSK